MAFYPYRSVREITVRLSDKEVFFTLTYLNLFLNSNRIYSLFLHLTFSIITISVKMVFQVVICSDFLQLGFLGLPVSYFQCLSFCVLRFSWAVSD